MRSAAGQHPACCSEGFDKAKIVRREETKPKKRAITINSPIFLFYILFLPREQCILGEEREIGMLVVVVKNSWT